MLARRLEDTRQLLIGHFVVHVVVRRELTQHILLLLAQLLARLVYGEIEGCRDVLVLPGLTLRETVGETRGVTREDRDDSYDQSHQDSHFQGHLPKRLMRRCRVRRVLHM